MDDEIERFRVDPQQLAEAREVCARLGIELADVLRAMVARIAGDGAIPFELPPPTAADDPFDTLDERLWSPLKHTLQAEAALALIDRTIADAAARLDADALPPETRARWRSALDEARRQRETLDVTDADAVRQVIASLRPPRGGDGAA